MASLGLPGLNGFVSEFLVVRGAWPVFTVITALSMIGLLFTGIYILKGIKLVLHGPLNERWVGHLKDISAREIIVLVPLVVLHPLDWYCTSLDCEYDQSSGSHALLMESPMQFPILSIIIFIPLVAGLLILLFPAERKTEIKATALAASRGLFSAFSSGCSLPTITLPPDINSPRNLIGYRPWESPIRWV